MVTQLIASFPDSGGRLYGAGKDACYVVGVERPRKASWIMREGLIFAWRRVLDSIGRRQGGADMVFRIRG